MTHPATTSDVARAETTQLDLEQLAHAICGARGRLPPARQRIALGIYRLLAEGRPVTVGAAADRLGAVEAEVDEALSGWPAAVRDDHDRVVGFGGLSLTASEHGFSVDGRALYAWCAWDTLFLPRLLGQAADVRSRCAVTGDAIELAVTPEGPRHLTPESTVVSMVVPDKPFDGDVVATFCCHVRFLSSREAAQPWLAERSGSFVLSLADAFELGRICNESVFADALD